MHLRLSNCGICRSRRSAKRQAYTPINSAARCGDRQGPRVLAHARSTVLGPSIVGLGVGQYAFYHFKPVLSGSRRPTMKRHGREAVRSWFANGQRALTDPYEAPDRFGHFEPIVWIRMARSDVPRCPARPAHFRSFSARGGIVTINRALERRVSRLEVAAAPFRANPNLVRPWRPRGLRGGYRGDDCGTGLRGWSSSAAQLRSRL